MPQKKTARKGTKKTSGLVDSAVDATTELAHAAESLRDSIDHVGKARKHGRVLTKKVTDTASRAKRAVVDTAKRMVRKKPAKRPRSKAKR